MLKDLIRNHFGEYRMLLDHVEVEVEGLLERQRKNTCDRIKWILDLENPPFTNNSHYFTSYRETYLNKYREARQVRRLEYCIVLHIVLTRQDFVACV